MRFGQKKLGGWCIFGCSSGPIFFLEKFENVDQNLEKTLKIWKICRILSYKNVKIYKKIKKSWILGKHEYLGKNRESQKNMNRIAGFGDKH